MKVVCLHREGGSVCRVNHVFVCELFQEKEDPVKKPVIAMILGRTEKESPNNKGSAHRKCIIVGYLAGSV